MRRFLPARIIVFCCLLAPSAYLAWSFRRMPHLGETGDDQIYLVSAKSLATGGGYRIPSLPGNLYQTKFPILYPLLLSFVWKSAPEFPRNLPIFMILNWLAMPLFLWLAGSTFRRLGFGEIESWGMCALLALNPGLIAASITLGPDLIFSVLLLSLLLLLSGAEHATAWRSGMAGALGGLLYLLRSAGIPLLLTVPLHLLWRRRKVRAGLFFAGMFPLVLAWSLYARAHITPPGDPTTVFYTDYFRDYLLNFSWRTAPVMLVKNLGWFLEYSGLLTVFIPLSPWPWLFGVLAVAGAASLVRRTGFTQYHLFAAAYCAMLVGWAGKPLLRYLLPVTPMLLAGLVHPSASVIGLLAPTARRWAGPVTFSLLLCWTAVIGFRPQFDALSRMNRGMQSEAEAYSWIRNNLPAEASFLARKDGVLYLETGRRATTYQPLKRDEYTGDQEALRRWREALPSFAQVHGAEYAFCDSKMCPGALTDEEAPLARAVLDRHYRAVYRSGVVTVYKLER
jgi:hypothetical protein